MTETRQTSTTKTDRRPDCVTEIRMGNSVLSYCKAMGVELKDRGITQVSMNLTDYSKTAICVICVICVLFYIIP